MVLWRIFGWMPFFDVCVLVLDDSLLWMKYLIGLFVDCILGGR